MFLGIDIGTSGVKAILLDAGGSVRAQATAPLVFGCTAGKDRTGIASAVLLRCLGVDMPGYFFPLMFPRWSPPPDSQDRSGLATIHRRFTRILRRLGVTLTVTHADAP